MRLRDILLVAAIGAAFTGVALGQQAAVTTPPAASNGISLAFDAVHGQLTASGVAVKAAPLTTSVASTSVTGTVNITLTINVVSKFSPGTRFPCAAILIGGEADTSIPLVDGGIETASGIAAYSSSTKTATCMLSIPFEWTLVSDAKADEGIFVGFAAAAVSMRDITQRSTIEIGGPLSLPPSGTTTTLAFTTTL